MTNKNQDTNAMPAVDRRRLHGKVAVVTGAARGIGRSIAERFASEGASVACLDVSQNRIHAAVEEMRSTGVDVHAFVVDVSQREAVQATFQQIESSLGAPISVLVNNAVWARYQSIEDVDEKTLDQMLAVGLKGVIWATQAAVPQMKRLGAGSVINLSSAAAVMAFSNSIAYCSLKAAVVGFTRAAAYDLGPSGIRVNAVAPGMIGTPASLEHFSADVLATRQQNIPLKRFGDVEEIASVATFLASSDSSYVNGSLLMVDGGVTIASI